ncbi:MAG: saccharopine dehydrogenase C-terminal domain-containing protein [Caldisphaera sp.]|nr:saccharopine dehydrogenase C-terminal domain-containing protein [Caldisphaera sp.]PMP88384.1 MAG: saccharopine dehydrogenase [Caldisphaera sp.]
MKKVGIVGIGNVGKRASFLLKREGYDIILLDSDEEKLKSFSKEINSAYKKVDVLDKNSLSSLGNLDLVVTSLPGSIAHDAVKNFVSLGFNVADVSFFPEDPIDINDIATENNVTVILDAGVAPGLSNMLISYGKYKLGNLTGGRIYVGGITEKPDPPLGLVITWNAMDLIDEYRRHARLINNKKIVTFDPLSSEIGKIYVNGLGELEYFPTDGLRSLLKTYSDLDFLAEYTLRWPGHVDFMKGLKKIGLLDHKKIVVKGKEVFADEFFSSLLGQNRYSFKDIVVLIVEAFYDKKFIRFTQIVKPDSLWSGMSRVTGSFLAYVSMEFLQNKLKGRGIIYPENLSEDLLKDIINKMENDGMPIIEEEINKIK